MPKKVPLLRARQKITDAWIRQLVETVNSLANVRGVFPIEVLENAGGPVIRLSRETKLEVFRLVESLDAGGSAAAVIQWQDTETEEWHDAPNHEIVVYDPLDTFVGEPGTPGWAKFHEQSGRWQIVQMACGPRESSSSSATGE